MSFAQINHSTGGPVTPAELAKIAQEALKQIQYRFPYGAINRLDGMQQYHKHEASPEIAYHAQIAYVTELYTSRRMLDLATFESKECPLQAACCDQLSHYALQFIKTKYRHVNVEVVFVNKYHCAIVIGRPMDSNPNDIKTWGDAILFDPWAPALYKASLRTQYCQTAPSLPFYLLDKASTEIDGREYLNGEPVIDLNTTFALLAMLQDPDRFLLTEKYQKQLMNIYKKSTDIHHCLRFAAAAGNKIHVAFLINALHADANGISKSSSRTVLDWAELNGHQECANIIKELGGKRFSELNIASTATSSRAGDSQTQPKSKQVNPHQLKS